MKKQNDIYKITHELNNEAEIQSRDDEAVKHIACCDPALAEKVRLMNEEGKKLRALLRQQPILSECDCDRCFVNRELQKQASLKLNRK